MYILGVNISHEPSACLLKDGEILYYCETERLTGEKYCNESELDFLHTEEIKKYTTEIDYVIFASYGSHYSEVDNSHIKNSISILSENGINFSTSLFYDTNHHIYHAANAFYASGFDNAVALVMDGGGAFDREYYNNYTSKKYLEFPFREVESIYDCSYNSFPNISSKWKHCAVLDHLEVAKLDNDTVKNLFWKRSENEIYSRNISCGDLFGVISSLFLNLGGNSEGKLMGLSGHRLKSKNDFINSLIRKECDDNNLFTQDWFIKKDDVWLTSHGILDKLSQYFEGYHNSELSFGGEDFYRFASLAYKLQQATFLHTCRLIKRALKISGKKKIVLSGGYFMNCVNNYKYTRIFPDIEFFVDPIPHDSGTAIGAAKYLWYGLTKSKQKYPFEHLYFGPEV